MADDGFEHFVPLVRALVKAGNRLVHEDRPGVFLYNQGGAYCALQGPLHFEAVRHLPRRPEVDIDEENDCIGCSHCWALIYGGEHAARWSG